jgi:putative tryptophan/tyrosine transport system substrate-binding protein
MRRRDIFGLLGGLTTAWALPASAQQPRVTTIGVLVRGAPGWQQFWRLFREALRELGYVEGKNIHLELRTDQGEIRRLPELAAELVALKVDVIVAWFTPAAVAAKQVTREIPIVCAICGDLVGTGLVESLARPGGNVTGSSSLNAQLSAKFIELIARSCRRRIEWRYWRMPRTPTPNCSSNRFNWLAKPPGWRSIRS